MARRRDDSALGGERARGGGTALPAGTGLPGPALPGRRPGRAGHARRRGLPTWRRRIGGSDRKQGVRYPRSSTAKGTIPAGAGRSRQATNWRDRQEVPPARRRPTRASADYPWPQEGERTDEGTPASRVERGAGVLRPQHPRPDRGRLGLRPPRRARSPRPSTWPTPPRPSTGSSRGAFSPTGFSLEFEALDRKVREVTVARRRPRVVHASGRAGPARRSNRRRDDDWSRPLPAGPILGGRPRTAIFGAITDHTAHHRGALTVYARLRGKTPTMPYME